MLKQITIRLSIILTVAAAIALTFVFRRNLPGPPPAAPSSACVSGNTSSTEFDSPHGYRFDYPSGIRLANSLIQMFSRNRDKDDVVFLTSASVQQEKTFLAEEAPFFSNAGLDITLGNIARAFSEKGVLITPGLPGDLEYLTKQSRIDPSREEQILGYIPMEFREFKSVTTTDGAQGIIFTVTQHFSATDTQSLPVTEAVFALNRQKEFPEWNDGFADGSDTVQIKIPADASACARSAFDEIVSTINLL
jgi:hypothetical protein